jgi:integrase
MLATTVPLSEYDHTWLPKREGFLFPNSRGEPFCSFSRNHTRLLKLSETTGWTLHDLRRTFATGMARLGTPIYVTEKILNHVSGSFGGAAGIYNRFDHWEERVTALKCWEEWVLNLTRYGAARHRQLTG